MPEFDPVHYIVLGSRLRSLQKSWNARAKAAKKRGEDQASERIKELSPCGQLAAIVRETIRIDDGGSYIPIGSVLRTYSGYGLSFNLKFNPQIERDIGALCKRVGNILTEAQRGNGRKFQAALVRYLWEHKGWRPARDEWPRYRRMLGPVAEPFFLAADQIPVESHLERSPAVIPSSYVARDVRNAVQRLAEDTSITFVGRENLIADIDRFVEQRERGENAGLMIITAPTGHGKSSLAKEWCRRHASDPSLEIIPLFCSLNESATRDPARGIEYLNAEIARLIFGTEAGSARPISELTGRLEDVTPDERRLILWLDGIDECTSEFDRFLPNELAKGTCVIISARANPAETPLYLLPFMAGPIFATYRPKRLDIGPFSRAEICEIIKSIEPKVDDDSVYNAASNIHEASKAGIPVLVSEIVNHWLIFDKDSLGCTVKIKYKTFFQFAHRELSKLKSREEWEKYGDLLLIIIALYERLDISALNLILGKGRRVKSVNLLPPFLARWLYLGNDFVTDRIISFTHPAMKDIFHEALTSDLKEIQEDIARALVDAPSGLAIYRAKYLARHLADSGAVEEAVKTVNSSEYFLERVTYLGVRGAVEATTEDIYFIEHTKDQALYLFGEDFRADVFAEAMQRCDDCVRREKIDILLGWYF